MERKGKEKSKVVVRLLDETSWGMMVPFYLFGGRQGVAPDKDLAWNFSFQLSMLHVNMCHYLVRLVKSRQEFIESLSEHIQQKKLENVTRSFVRRKGFSFLFHFNKEREGSYSFFF